jgi:hypothetical protein
MEIKAANSTRHPEALLLEGNLEAGEELIPEELQVPANQGAALGLDQGHRQLGW